MNKCNGTCEVCDCVIPAAHLRQHAENINWEQAAAARLRNVNEMAVHIAHLESLLRGKLDPLDMFHPPDFRLWRMDMESSGYQWYGGRWMKNGEFVELEDAAELWLHGKTPSMPDKWADWDKKLLAINKGLDDVENEVTDE